MLAADIVGSGHLNGPAHAVRQARQLLDTQPPEAGRFVVAMAGMFRYNSTLPAIPGMPAHRPWQRQRAETLYPLVQRILKASST
jgi:hypothetical protein